MGQRQPQRGDRTVKIPVLPLFSEQILVILYYERAAVGGMDDGGSNRVGGAL